MHVFLTPAASELFTEFNMLEVEAEVLCVMLDLLEGSHLARAHHLMFVEQKDWDACSGDEFVDLRAIAAQLRAGVPVGGRFPDAMCLIHDKDVQAVGISCDE